ncbi:uncharacterized protein MELLADRAFT_106596 [Melampsora larici-populina 98AG31]|uniref:Uncharacterized protein n=1 Tax=Melampsora larici-populina (strain 98AG31 / pathotype 3-4-7) TaxID=747676 RepID=F4RM08_MELLP|nr:uncharacterized protein MELLADRAFT_106596 [Melampsora larici-populina 98AG31]EGG06669.1 hypothetical protein MELLADRAFT_106596 [Melampsora larici-populina 98AG31]
MAVPLPMQFSGILDDVGRFGRNTVKNSDVIKDSGKGLGTLKPTDDVMPTTKAFDHAQISMSKLRHTGFDEFKTGKLSKFADETTSGKDVNSASSASNGKDSITLPGTEISLRKLRLERAAMLVSNGIGKYQDWRKKLTQMLAKTRTKFRSRTSLMTEDTKKLEKIPQTLIKNSKSKLIELRKEAIQSFSKLKPTRKHGGIPIGLKRIVGVLPIKSFKSVMNRFKMSETEPGKAVKTLPETQVQPPSWKDNFRESLNQMNPSSHGWLNNSIIFNFEFHSDD